MSNNNSVEGWTVWPLLLLTILFIISNFVGWEVRREEYQVPEGRDIILTNQAKGRHHFEKYKPGTKLDIHVWWYLWHGESKYCYGVRPD